MNQHNESAAKNICEEKVFESVFNNRSEQLRNFLYYKSGNLALAEDLVQDAFSKLWENCSKVTLDKAKSYLFTIANNLFLNKMEHKKVVLKFQSLAPNTDVDKQSPEFLLEHEEFKNRLEAAISSLPEDQRTVFLMNRIDKKKYREIAEELGLSVKAVEKRMHKALQELRKIHKKV